jgi:hypothetical protein
MDLSTIVLLLSNKQDRSLTESLVLLILASATGLILKSDELRTYVDSFINRYFKKKVKSEYTIKYNEYQCPLTGFGQQHKSTASEPLPYELLAMIDAVDKIKPQIKGGININKGNQSLENYKTDYTIVEPNGIKITNDIYLRTKSTRKRKRSEGENTRNFLHIEHNLILYSYTLNHHELIKNINDWTQKYINDIDKPIEGLLFCEYKKKHEEIDPHNYGWLSRSEIKQFNHNWNIMKFETNKSFDNIFFLEKESLLKRLDKFSQESDFYFKMGIPHMFGLLLHGTPGSGKSSTIKAIAKKLNMHILSVPLNKIKTASELVDIFTNPYINNKKIPIDKRIYVFEDIDCMSDVVMKREGNDDKNEMKHEKKKSSESVEKQTIIINNKDSKMEYVNSDVDELTLHTILNILDGLMEQPGRVVIMTTNYPELLDPALIRSGRIDMKINFGHTTTKTIREMFEFYYKDRVKNDESDSKFEDLLKNIETSDFLDRKFSAADVISEIIASLDNPFTCYESLIKKSKDLILNPVSLTKYRSVRSKKQKIETTKDDKDKDKDKDSK